MFSIHRRTRLILQASPSEEYRILPTGAKKNGPQRSVYGCIIDITIQISLTILSEETKTLMGTVLGTL